MAERQPLLKGSVQAGSSDLHGAAGARPSLWRPLIFSLIVALGPLAFG